MKWIKYAVVALLSITFSLAFAGDKPAGKFSGYMFGDYYYILKNHKSELQKRNGFWLRRIYFTYDRKLDDAFSVRLRLEMAHPGDFTTKAAAVPFVKDAYLKYKSGQHQIILGISPTPTWELIEKTWGYRSVEKTPLDLQKFGSSRDFGVAFKGSLGESGMVKYHLMFANGNSNKSETDKSKKVLGAVSFYPTTNIIVEVYGDYDGLFDAAKQFTLQGFAAYKTDRIRLGLHYVRQVRKVEGSEDLVLDMVSAFIAGQMSEALNFFLRVDKMLDPNPKGDAIAYIPFDPTAKSTFFVGGLDFTPIKKVHLMPNIEAVVYETNADGVKPDSDLIPRLTFYYKF